jgi:hypothetical protein
MQIRVIELIVKATLEILGDDRVLVFFTLVEK